MSISPFDFPSIRVLLLFAVGLAMTTPAWAQRYWSPQEIEREALSRQSVVEEAFDPRGPAPDYTPNDPLAQMLEEGIFIDKLQVKTPGTTFGGLEEAEHIPFFVETDNTTEGIWVWSRYRQLTGDTRFDQNIADAWTYVMNHPAYLEEGGTGPDGYYRVYNCGWAVIAEPMYRAATGDTSKLAYARDCAVYLRDNPLAMRSFVNAMVQAWAAGALHGFATEQNDAALKSVAVDLAAATKDYAERNPSIFRSERWAMAGGALVWGILRAYFQEKPGGRSWARTWGPDMKVIVVGGMWRHSRSGWYALGRYEAWKATASPEFFDTFHEIYDHLVALDHENDGGIAATHLTATNQDESWTSNYVAFMAMERAMQPADISLAADRRRLPLGEILGFRIGVANHDQLQSLTMVYRLEATGPGVGPIPLGGPKLFRLRPGEARKLRAFQSIPATLPAGSYQLRLQAAIPGGGPVREESLRIELH